MKEKRKMILFTLMLTAIFSITTVCGRTGHGGHGHSSHGHSSGGHSSGGHSSGSHSSGGHSSGVHGSSGDSGHGESSIGHASHGTSGLGSHHTDESWGSHVESGGLAHPNSHYDPEGLGRRNSDSDLGGYGDSGHIHDGSSQGHNGYYPINHLHHHHQAHHEGHNVDMTTTTTTTTPPPKIEEKWLDLSCDKGLPDFMGKKYPQKRVVSAVERLKKMLNSGDTQYQIKYEVKNYFYTINFQFEFPYGSAADRATDCQEVKSHIAPLGGCDVNSSAYIIVNIPDLKQEIKTSDCRAWTFCDYSNGAMCLQSKKTEKLLVLPAKKGPFNLSDFNVATFKVNDGCKCLAGDQINVFNIHDYGF